MYGKCNIRLVAVRQIREHLGEFRIKNSGLKNGGETARDADRQKETRALSMLSLANGFLLIVLVQEDPAPTVTIESGGPVLMGYFRLFNGRGDLTKQSTGIHRTCFGSGKIIYN